MELKNTGCHRIVILTKRYAIKIPRFTDGWKIFLTGLLANMQEIVFSKAKWPELCPVLFYISGGWLLVMPRVVEMTNNEFIEFNVDNFINTKDYVIPAEKKSDSFGYYRGHVVVIDYGSK